MFETGDSLAKTRTNFLRAVSGCYALAFISIYLQMDGLFGDRGVLPLASRAATQNPENFLVDPSLIWVGKFVGLSLAETAEVLALVGGIAGFVGAVHRPLLNKLVFAFMFLAYLTVFKLGQTFLWFQWDTLLLEVGGLAILVAPTRGKTWFMPRPRDHITMMTVRFLLFRMMFASGVVKLQSGCKEWWGLTAMPLHYESQCIPTWLSWWAYNIPYPTLHKLSVALTFVTEIPVVLLFYHPVKSVRKFAFLLQVQLMIGIMLTGNYNFFNFLYLALCLSLLDDGDFRKSIGLKPVSNCFGSSRFQRRGFTLATSLATFAALAYLTMKSFYLPARGTKGPELKVVPSRDKFDTAVTEMTYIGLGLATVSMAYSFLLALARCAWPQDAASRLSRSFVNFFSLVFHSFLCMALFAMSVPVFLRGINQQGIIAKEPWLTKMYPTVQGMSESVDGLQLIHSYGLFRTMTGVGGRPEIIIEGSHSPSGPWEEYPFLYKPGNVSRPLLPFVLPHQPRLDWQMWFAALGSYQHNPWLVSLLYRIMQGETSVLALLDRDSIPKQFIESPPKLMRVTSYKYHFTGHTNQQGTSGKKKKSSAAPSKTEDWWYRDSKTEYLHSVSADNLQEYLTQVGILLPDESIKNRRSGGGMLSNIVSKLRTFHQKFQPHFVVQQVFLAMIILPYFIF